MRGLVRINGAEKRAGSELPESSRTIVALGENCFEPKELVFLDGDALPNLSK